MNLNNLDENERAIVIEALKLLEKKAREDSAKESRRSDMSIRNLSRLHKREKEIEAVTKKALGVGYFI